MAETGNSLGSQLFNNPLFSDVKIIQSRGNERKEYHAHKSVLIIRSEWFFKAFTGMFKEATAAEVEVYDDNPEHFEVLMRFCYSANWEEHFLKFSGFKLRKEIMAVHALASKYASPDLKHEVTKLYPEQYSTIMTEDELGTLIRCHYDHCFSNQCALGEKLVTDVLCKHDQFVRNEGLKLVREYPRLGRDIFAVMQEQSKGTVWEWLPNAFSKTKRSRR